ncbi:rhodanese-like domain-containing protein [Methylococcus sp. EFPC2]|uniref:rhodanese-like domain-containing protein n=1 Tax=Methylococcus sp. EFPC2 TaxID=2812648 RepID=UPI0019687C57|nr:rhodanese-like domain-containing protein [Methylococcus sp. EFPC2]QSA96423.1 rhodanese-like domain-containing protein [Methylococcus sp. EFPC2]
MKKLAKPMLVLLTLAAPAAFAAEGDAAKNAGAKAAPAAAQQQEYKYKTPKLNRAQIDALLAKPDQVLFIDVRRPDEVSKVGSFPVYLSVQAGDLEKNLAFIPKDRTLVPVSNHAGRAGAAGDLLASKGFKVGGAVGSQNYEEEGGTITKIAVPPPRTAEAKAPEAAKK